MMRKIPVTKLEDLLNAWGNNREMMENHVWDTPLTGVGTIKSDVGQFTTPLPQSSGFIWGRSVWGVDEVDDETSVSARKYDLGD